MRAAGRAKGTPYHSSFMRLVPLPSPRLMRPPESSSRSRAAVAWITGERVKAFAIAVPRPMRSVASATAPSTA